MTKSLSHNLKLKGIRSVRALARFEGVGTPTIYRWQKEQPELLQSAIERYLGRK